MIGMDEQATLWHVLGGLVVAVVLVALVGVAGVLHAQECGGQS